MVKVLFSWYFYYYFVLDDFSIGLTQLVYMWASDIHDIVSNWRNVVVMEILTSSSGIWFEHWQNVQVKWSGHKFFTDISYGPSPKMAYVSVPML